MKARTFSISVDCEDILGSSDASTNLWACRVGRELWGVPRILDELGSFALRATFYLDFLNCMRHLADEEVRDFGLEIARRGHEIGVHTHPPRPGGGIRHRFPSPTGFMFEYSLDRQRAFIETCVERAVSWTGCTPSSHRAGSYAMNRDTLRAVRETGLKVDASLFWGASRPDDPQRQGSVGTWDCEGVRLLTVTQVTTIVRMSMVNLFRFCKKLDVNWMSATECEAVIASDLPHVDLFLHGHSLYDSRRQRPDWGALRTFRAAMHFLRAHRELVCHEEVPRLESWAAPRVLVPTDLLRVEPREIVRLYGRAAMRRVSRLFQRRG